MPESYNPVLNLNTKYQYQYYTTCFKFQYKIEIISTMPPSSQTKHPDLHTIPPESNSQCQILVLHQRQKSGDLKSQSHHDWEKNCGTQFWLSIGDVQLHSVLEVNRQLAILTEIDANFSPIILFLMILAINYCTILFIVL